MKTPLPVTLDDLQATARDARDAKCIYGGITVYYIAYNQSFAYACVGHGYVNKAFVILKLAEHGKPKK